MRFWVEVNNISPSKKSVILGEQLLIAEDSVESLSRTVEMFRDAEGSSILVGAAKAMESLEGHVEEEDTS